MQTDKNVRSVFFIKAKLDGAKSTKLCFGTIAQTICEYLGVDASSLDGHSVWNEIKA